MGRRCPEPGNVMTGRYRFWWFQLAGWSCFAVAMSFSRVGSFPLSAMVIDKGLLTVFGVVASLMLRALYRRVEWQSMSLSRLGLLVVGASYVVSILWTVPYNAASNALHVFGDAYRSPLFGGVVYDAFVLVAWSALYMGILMYTTAAQERERRLHAQALAKEAELRALRYQLNPHFFFNSLNALSTLVLDGRTKDATDMIARMGDFMRSTLSDGTSMCRLENELETTELYLSIEQIRFGDRLQVVLDVDPEAAHVMVPRLLLQPLVENAIVHGIAHLEAGGIIEVRTMKKDDGVAILIENPLSPDPSATSGSGVGLVNVRRRLEAVHGAAATLKTGTTSNGTMRVTIHLPAE